MADADVQASAGPATNVLQPQEVEMDAGQQMLFWAKVHKELRAAVQAHEKRQAWLAELLKAYKALPLEEVKNFPWPNASNVVVPIVAVSVDTVAARLHRAVFGAKEPVEAHINTVTPFMMTVPPDPTAAPGSPESQPRQVPLDDKTVRDWCSYLFRTGWGDKIRTIFADMPLYGDAFVSPLWVEEKKTYHAYDAQGAVVTVDVPQYTGTRLSIYPPDCVFWSTGYDEWDQLPWQAIRLRYSYPELIELVAKGVFKMEDVKKLKPVETRDDKRRKVTKRTEHVTDTAGEIYELYEIRGMWEIPNPNPDAVPHFEEVVLTYSLDYKVGMRAIYNPYFGKVRHLVKIPYLVQPHELVGQGVAEQALPFQREASTSHNQVIDAATAANAGITVLGPGINVGPNEEIHPGKTLTTDGDAQRDINIVHLGEPSQALGAVEEKAFFMNEKRTGVSVYNMGMESPTVGSRATATGTTALINEGNQRFWVSIDDMRKALEELLYLAIQQEQQMRPEGYYFEKGRYIQFPQGDPRQAIALRLSLSSESVNRDIEVQQMQILIQVLNDYYARLNQAMMLIANPQFPPVAKQMAVATINAASKIIRKFVERFDVENLDEVVPSIMQAMAQMGDMLNGQMGGPPQQPQGGSPGGPGSGPGGPAQPNAPGGRPQRPLAPAGGGPVRPQ